MDGSIGAIRFAADGRTIARLYQSGAHDRVDWDEEQQTGLTGLTCFGLKPEASQNGAGSTPAFAVKDGLTGVPRFESTKPHVMCSNTSGPLMVACILAPRSKTKARISGATETAIVSPSSS